MAITAEKNLATENWYAESVANVFKNLNLSSSAAEQGLSSIEAVKRLKANGPNALPAPESPGVFKLFLRQFQSPLIYILLIASVVVYFLGDLTDSLVILGVLLINAIIGLYQEGRAHNTLNALRSFTKTEAVAIRDGIEMSLPDVEIVPGDIIMLREGDKIPADARLIEVRTFAVNESALTGESIPVSKSIETISHIGSRGARSAHVGARGADGSLAADSVALGDQKNMVFKGTFAVSGFAKAVVVTTGVNTVIGAISKQIVTLNTEIPLKKDIRKLSRLVAIGTLVASALVFILGFAQGNSASTMFFTAVAVVVSLIPEGLPIVITIVLASGAYRMAKQNALVKNLDAVEALGQATVIAVDKTGTITKNELMVETIWVAGKKFSVGGSGYEPVGAIVGEEGSVEVAFMGKIATFCASARVAFNEQEKIWHVAGDPTEAALLVFGEKAGFKKDELEVASPQIAELPFDSKLKYHLTLHNVGGKQFMTIVGAPEAILPLCNKQWFPGADSSPAKSSSPILTIARKSEIEKQVHSMSKSGQRVIAAAVIPAFKGELEPEKIGAESKATFVGVFGMRDTLREGVREAVDAARERGLKVVMITGDHKVTAETIAREAGIFRDGDEVLTDKDLRELNETELLMRLPRVSVFARISPDEKLQLINLYRKNGEIVAMTGDGVNDALSLVAADLGVAMGKIGTEVSKEAADIVLLDDNFKSIVTAIDEGRNMYRSIKKVILYLFSTGFGELFTVLFALLLAFPLPLFPTQILWLNLVTDGFFVFALGLETEKTRDNRRRQMFDKLTVLRMSLISLVMAAGSIFLFASYYQTDFVKASTMALTVLAVFQWFNAWNVRSENETIFSRHAFSNPFIILSTLAAVVLQLAAIYVPFLQKLLHTKPLSFYELSVVVGIAVSIILVEEIRKYFTRRYLAGKFSKLAPAAAQSA